jgi:hypothetical protein
VVSLGLDGTKLTISNFKLFLLTLMKAAMCQAFKMTINWFDAVFKLNKAKILRGKYKSFGDLIQSK